MQVPHLTKKQSAARIRQLRARGCKVQKVRLPSGDVAVLKSCKGLEENPKRPPKNWWDRCVQGVGKSGDAYSPQQVCGSLWYHKLSAAEKRRITREAEGKLQENIDTTSALAGVGIFFVGAILLGAVLSVTR